MLGNLAVSVIAGVLALIWLLVFGVPYVALLAITVAIPVVGSVVGSVLVSLVVLTVSLPVCLATAGFFIVYRLLEDYLLVPRIIGGAVKIPALVTVVAVIVGGALLGIIGALVASRSPPHSC